LSERVYDPSLKKWLSREELLVKKIIEQLINELELEGEIDTKTNKVKLKLKKVSSK